MNACIRISVQPICTHTPTHTHMYLIDAERFDACRTGHGTGALQNANASARFWSVEQRFVCPLTNFSSSFPSMFLYKPGEETGCVSILPESTSGFCISGEKFLGNSKSCWCRRDRSRTKICAICPHCCKLTSFHTSTGSSDSEADTGDCLAAPCKRSDARGSAYGHAEECNIWWSLPFRWHCSRPHCRRVHLVTCCTLSTRPMETFKVHRRPIC